MPNTFVTPKWLSAHWLTDAPKLRVGETIRIKLPARFQMKPEKPEPIAPLDGKVLLALGAAAVIASPRKLSRRSFFGLGWKRDA